MNRLLNWFYCSYLGMLYFEFLLWIDKKSNKHPKYLNPKEIAQIVREYSLVDEGVVKMKSTINNLINSKSKEEYNQFLSEIEDMINFAKEGDDTPKAKLVKSLREVYVKKGNKDIVTAKDRAIMINDRINDMYALQADKEKRQLLRDIRKANKNNEKELANKLQMEYKLKYGRTNTGSRQS